MEKKNQGGYENAACVESHYSTDDPIALVSYMQEANIRLVRAEYVWKLHDAKKLLPRRQEAESEGFDGPSGWQSAMVSLEEMEKWARGEVQALFCSISHCWESREHPDPCGHQLELIAKGTSWYAKAYDAPVWLFIDYTSLFQYKRNSNEEVYFRSGMGHMHLLYCHEHTLTLGVQSLTSDDLWKQLGRTGHKVLIYHEPSNGMKEVTLDELTKNLVPYLLRGWCISELEWSSARSDSTSHQRIDDADATELKGKMPLLPAEFQTHMQSLQFTHRPDQTAVVRLQEAVFMEKVTRRKSASFANVDDEGLRVLLHSLPCYTHLEAFKLSHFRCDNATLFQLCEWFKECLRNNSLKELVVEFSKPQSEEDSKQFPAQANIILKAIAEAMPKNSSLRRFHLNLKLFPQLYGLQALAEAMPKNTTLLDLDVIGEFLWKFLKDDHGLDRSTLISDGHISEAWESVLTHEKKCNQESRWIQALLEIETAARSNKSKLQSNSGEKVRSVRPPVKSTVLAEILNQNSSTLKLAGKGLGDAGAKELAEVIKVNKTLKRIDLTYNQIGNAGAQALAEAIKGNKTLKRIDLTYNKISDAGALALAEAIQVNNTVTEMIVDRNSIGDDGARSLAQAIQTNHVMSALHLDRNNIGDAGAQALAEAVRVNQTLTALFLSRNNIGDAGAQALAEAVRVSQTLTMLRLDNNNIADAGAQALAEALRANKTATVVTLAANNIGDTGAQAFAETVKVNKTLTGINMGNNLISATGAEALAEAIRVNETVVVINLKGNSIGDAGAQALAEAVRASQTLIALHLGSNSIGNAGVQALAEALKVNNTVIEITLEKNSISDSGVQALAEAVRVNQTLTTLHLDRNNFGDAGAKALAEAISVNKLVTEICFAQNQISDAESNALAEAIQVNFTRCWQCRDDRALSLATFTIFPWATENPSSSLRM